VGAKSESLWETSGGRGMRGGKCGAVGRCWACEMWVTGKWIVWWVCVGWGGGRNR